jgi:hypothetical protein
MENREIARVLGETADLMEIAGEDSFRIRSYRNGATAIDGYPERVIDILRDPDRKVTEIPGGLAPFTVNVPVAGPNTTAYPDGPPIAKLYVPLGRTSVIVLVAAVTVPESGRRPVTLNHQTLPVGRPDSVTVSV